MSPADAVRRVRRAFRAPGAVRLLTPRWREENLRSSIRSTGFCYIAAEAVFHLAGGVRSGLRPHVATLPDGTHWWLVCRRSRAIFDPTWDQYLPDTPPYALGRPCGFLSGHARPSRRAERLIELSLR